MVCFRFGGMALCRSAKSTWRTWGVTAAPPETVVASREKRSTCTSRVSVLFNFPWCLPSLLMSAFTCCAPGHVKKPNSFDVCLSCALFHVSKLGIFFLHLKQVNLRFYRYICESLSIKLRVQKVSTNVSWKTWWISCEIFRPRSDREICLPCVILAKCWKLCRSGSKIAEQGNLIGADRSMRSARRFQFT